MSKKVKAFLYNLLGFAILFVGFRYVIAHFTGLHGIWIPLTAFMVGTLTAPKFQAMQTPDGEKLFMRWIIFKGVKEIK